MSRIEEDVGTNFDEVHGNKSQGHGYVVGTMANGDKMYVRIQGSSTLKDSVVESAEGAWSFTGGTGKLKGVKARAPTKAKVRLTVPLPTKSKANTSSPGSVHPPASEQLTAKQRASKARRSQLSLLSEEPSVPDTYPPSDAHCGAQRVILATISNHSRQSEWSFTSLTRRAPVQPAPPITCSRIARTSPVTGVPGNGGLALLGSAWQASLLRTAGLLNTNSRPCDTQTPCLN